MEQQKITKVTVNGNTYQLGSNFSGKGYYKVSNTLTTEPTVDTKTYTLNGDVLNYEIGQVVRVVDTSSDTGYSFYRLHDIDSNGLAIWSKLDTGLLDLPETVTVHVTSNQSSIDDLIGATITVNGESKTFNGSDLIFSVPEDTQYTVSASSVTGYATPVDNNTYTALFWGSREVILQYNTEIVNVSSQFEDGTTANPTYSLIIDGGTTQASYSVPNPTFPYKVPYGASYTITPGDLDGYTTPSAYTKTAADTTQAVVFTYEEIKNGVFIYTTSGQLVNPDSWTGSTNDAVGVAVITDVCSFVIGKTNLGYNYWDNSYSSNGVISGVTATDSTDTAKVDYNGVANTNVMRLKSSGCETAKACYNSTVTINGSTVHGYLGGCGEWWLAYQNKAAVDSAMSKCGGTAIPTSNYHWTSTLHLSYYSNAWLLGWYDGSVNYSNKSSSRYVRPFYPLA